MLASQHTRLIHAAPNPMPVLPFGMIVVADEEPVFDVHGPGEILAELISLVIADPSVIRMKRDRIVQNRAAHIWAHGRQSGQFRRQG